MCLVLRVPAAESAFGQGLRTGAHLRCFPSHRCAAGPSPFTKPRAATPSEVPAHPAFPGRGIIGLQGCPCFDLCAAVIVNSGPEIENRCRDYLRFDLLAASICKSGLEIENRCTDCPCFDLFAASIRKSGLEIENQCTDCPVLTLWLHRFASLGLKSRIDAALSCRQVEWPACGRTLPLR